MYVFVRLSKNLTRATYVLPVFLHFCPTLCYGDSYLTWIFIGIQMLDFYAQLLVAPIAALSWRNVWLRADASAPFVSPIIAKQSRASPESPLKIRKILRNLCEAESPANIPYVWSIAASTFKWASLTVPGRYGNRLLNHLPRTEARLIAKRSIVSMSLRKSIQNNNALCLL